MNDENNKKVKIARRDKEESKKLAIKFIIILLSLFSMLVVFNILLSSGVFSDLFDKKTEVTQEPIFFYEPNYDENIFEDEDYLDLNRYIRYTEGALSTLLVNEKMFVASGDAAVFFGKYFEAIINGEYEKYSSFFTEEYIDKNGVKDRFTMQKIYDVEVEKLSAIFTDRETNNIRYEFRVGYCILENNGTFRDDIGSNASRPQIFELIMYNETGEIKINSISNYNIKN